MTDPLRVLLLTSRLSPAAGGLAVSVPGLAHSIDPLPDMEMHVFGTLDPGNPAAAQGWGPRVQGFDVTGPQAGQYAPGMAPAIAALAPDIVDVQGIWTYPSLANLRHARRTGTPYLVTPRGMLDPWARRNSAWKKKIAGTLFEQAHLKGACALRATAEMEAQHFRDMGMTNPIAVVPNGLTLPDLAPRSDRDLRSILFLSRIHPKKGVDFLLQAWATLQAEFPGWEIVIAGIDENGHEADLKALTRNLGLSRVRFVGEAHGDAKQKLYRDADLFVLPTHAENFGLVVAEALAQETPVITTRNAPWQGLESEACGWWIDLDQGLLTDTLRQALSRPAQDLAAMGRRGRAWVQRDFAMSQVAEKMREVYLWAARRGARPEYVHD
ncbi:glycosyltransferase [uncultured Mameliella sp.]|uniref:glycosyltransferase n=1 Tax=uncultured Mameliella sp. TaxID=1447087 RepID=UPI002631B08D|nr:glycosyltransferase [uncultured Mameliella sp.]